MVVSRVSVTSVSRPPRLMVWRLVVRLGVGRMPAYSSSCREFRQFEEGG